MQRLFFKIKYNEDEMMGYKKCGFRDKAQVCNFKEEDCNSEECDFYDIGYTVKDIKKKIREERKNVINLHNKLKEMKANHQHKTKKTEYDELKKDRNDKAIGVFKLSKAYAKVKRMKIK